ncbi:MAG: SDR family oxidoreductase [Thermodesulfobacteriota bacterium]
MRAAITGASGLVGGNLALELLARGHEVRATRRSEASTRHLQGHPIEWTSADLDDVRALTASFEGADVVFHCAALVSILRRATPALIAANVDGTRNVIAAVRAARVPRLVHCSTVGAVGLSTDGVPCTEDAPWNFADYGLDDGYVTTKHRAELLVQDAVRAGLDAVIVSPTYMFGPYDAKPSSGKMMLGVVLRQAPGYSTGSNNFVDVRDVARGMLLAWQKGRSGERYILGGDNMTYDACFRLIARVAGVPPLTWRVPRPIAGVVGLLGDLQHVWTGKEPLITSNSVRWAYTDRFQFSSAKAERELGYRHGALERAVADAIAWFRAQGMLADLKPAGSGTDASARAP